MINPALLVFLTMTPIAPPRVAAADSGPFAVVQVEVAPNVYAFVERELSAIVSSNVVVVIGTRDVLAFDAGHHPLTTRHIIGEIKKLTDKPVRYLVVSHWHDDHWVGNAEFAKAYPGVEVIAHPFTADLMETRKETFRGDPCRNELKGGIDDYSGRLANGKGRDGAPMSETSLRRVKHFLAGFIEERDQCDIRVFRGVDRRVDQALSIDLGGRHVELQFLGRGNTAGDLVAYLPESKTVLTGDLVVAPFPFATQSYITEWARVLRRIEQMDLTALVPGHGPVQHDKQYLRDLAETLEAIEHQARAVYTPEMTAPALKAKIDLSTFAERFGHGDPFLLANFNYMMKDLAVGRMWEELAGKLKPEGI